MLGPSSVFGMRPKAAASIHISLSYLCVGWYTIIGPHLFRSTRQICVFDLVARLRLVITLIPKNTNLCYHW